MVKVDVKSGNYDWKVGVLKTLKNAAIFLVPSVLAWLAGIEGQWAALAGVLAYYVKNWYANR